MSLRGHIAAIRFGLGLRLGEPPPTDPEAWLLAQLARPGAPLEGPSIADSLRVRAAEIIARRPNNPVGDRAATTAALVELVRAESLRHGSRQLAADQPFRERLVDFWMNHFTVSRRLGSISSLIGAYEREAIRAHVTGRFADMMVAVARHPAMLIYLDNAGSVGAGSPAGQRAGGRGLNENFAREVLELHTLSPAGGYTQGDVQEFAKVLTGWSVAQLEEPFGFVFRRATHEPGEKRMLGRRFPEGEEGGEAALRFLAEQPATWRHLAVKLARHFVADDPPPEAVRVLEAALRDTRGDLGAVATALVRLPQAWDPPLAKFRSPGDFVIAAARALGVEPDRPELVVNGMATLAQTLWSAPQPNGWPDTAADWATPDALMRRVDWVYTLAGRASRVDQRAVADAALGPLGRAETASEMARAGSVRDALTLLLGSPEFMRR